jgi:hypothetical protein
MRTPLDIASEALRIPDAGERRSTTRELLEITKLWLYWEKHIDPPRETLLRSLRAAESMLERAS